MHSLTLNSEERRLWAAYWGLIEEARRFAVWRHEEDGQTRPDGRQRPPRFVAVIEDARHLARLAERAEEVAGLPGLWPLQVHQEAWEWARVQVNAASHSARLPAGVPVVVGPVERGQVSAALEVAGILRKAGHAARVVDLEDGQALEVVPGQDGLTARNGHGRAFRLRAWDADGLLVRDKLSVGAVVVQSLGHIEDATGRHRKPRADALPRLASWAGVSLFQPPASARGVQQPSRRVRGASTALPAPALPLGPLGAEPLFLPAELAGGGAPDGAWAQVERLEFNRAVPAPKNLSGTARRVLEAVAAGASLVRAGERWQLAEPGSAARFVDRRTVARLQAEGLLVPA